jgi:hypothetical protein
MTSSAVRHEFVNLIPDELVEGTLYVSIPYAIAVHKCMSGCGLDVVTPLSPTDWELISDGETVSLFTLGWKLELALRVPLLDTTGSRAVAPRWSREEIARGRARDAAAKESYFATRLQYDEE